MLRETPEFLTRRNALDAAFGELLEDPAFLGRHPALAYQGAIRTREEAEALGFSVCSISYRHAWSTDLLQYGPERLYDGEHIIGDPRALSLWLAETFTTMLASRVHGLEFDESLDLTDDDTRGRESLLHAQSVLEGSTGVLADRLLCVVDSRLWAPVSTDVRWRNELPEKGDWRKSHALHHWGRYNGVDAYVWRTAAPQPRGHLIAPGALQWASVVIPPSPFAADILLQNGRFQVAFHRNPNGEPVPDVVYTSQIAIKRLSNAYGLNLMSSRTFY